LDRKQRIFLTITATFVALFALALLVLRASQQQTLPGPFPAPAWTITPLAPHATATLPASPFPNFKTPTAPAGRSFYAAPDGIARNEGSKEHPWPLQYVLDQPGAIQPGDTIWLLGGKYTGPFTSHLKGAEGKPVNIRAVPGQRVTLQSSDLVLDIADSYYANFWDLEITAINNKRDPNHPNEGAYGIRINQGKSSHDIKFINLIVHDMPAQGIGFWQANTNSEVYGCLVYDNGITQFDHGIYIHNTDGEKRIIDNFIFDNASHGIHAYGEKNYQKLNNILIEGNTVFNNGSIGYATNTGAKLGYKRNILVGGLQVAEKPIVKENYTYFSGDSATGEAFNLGYRAGSEDAIVEDNYFAGGRVILGGINSGVKIAQNTILDFKLASIQGLGLIQGDNQFLTIKPSSSKIFVRPNQYEPGRANITVYNWGNTPQLSLTDTDLRDIQIQKGSHYELHNVQDYFNDVATGTYDGEKLILPMTGHTVAQPMGLDHKPDSTFPEFGAFVLVVIPQNPAGD
jgi:hypothetical protein